MKPNGGGSIPDDLALEFAGNAAAAVRLHPFPEFDVVPMLRRVVEQRAALPAVIGGDNDLFERFPRKRASFQKGVGGDDIGVVMFVVMELQGFRRHVRLQAVVWIWQWGKFEGHLLYFLGSDGIRVPVDRALGDPATVNRAR